MQCLSSTTALSCGSAASSESVYEALQESPGLSVMLRKALTDWKDLRASLPSLLESRILLRLAAHLLVSADIEWQGLQTRPAMVVPSAEHGFAMIHAIHAALNAIVPFWSCY